MGGRNPTPPPAGPPKKPKYHLELINPDGSSASFETGGFMPRLAPPQPNSGDLAPADPNPGDMEVVSSVPWLDRTNVKGPLCLAREPLPLRGVWLYSYHGG